MLSAVNMLSGDEEEGGRVGKEQEQGEEYVSTAELGNNIPLVHQLCAPAYAAMSLLPHLLSMPYLYPCGAATTHPRLRLCLA